VSTPDHDALVKLWTLRYQLTGDPQIADEAVFRAWPKLKSFVRVARPEDSHPEGETIKVYHPNWPVKGGRK